MTWKLALAGSLLATALTPAVPATAAPGTFTFAGTATTSGCFGCGDVTATFAGSFTGVVDGHRYDSAPLRMSFTLTEPGSTCPVTGTAYGTMQVSDTTRSDSWSFAWTRAYVYGVVATMHGASGDGNFASTFVFTSPVGSPCGSPVTVAMHGAGAIF